MDTLTATLGLAMLSPAGIATVLALVILVLFEVRCIARLGGRITAHNESSRPRFFEDAAGHR